MPNPRPSQDATLLDRIAGNTALLAVSRVGMPIALGWLMWATGSLIAVERRVAVIEAGREATARQAATSADLIGRMEGRQAATEATLTQVLRSLTRIETVLDQRR